MVTPAERPTSLILIIEDDATISDLVAYNLSRAGYQVRKETNGRNGLEAALSDEVDLVLMDLMLPGLDGLAATREIKRQKPDLPVVMLTARDERGEVLEGFDTGADDYVTKPFDMELLLARIQARLRHQVPAGRPSGRLEVGGLILDHDAHALFAGQTVVPLKPKEFDLLTFFFANPGRLFEREEIVEAVWHHRYLPGSRTLDVHIRRLREKLQEVGRSVEIETVRGVGYRLTATPTPTDPQTYTDPQTPSNPQPKPPTGS